MSLHFFPLTYLEEGDEVVVGRTDIDSYGVFPPDGATLLRELANGRPPAEAAAWYAQRYQEPVDIEEFLDTVRGLGFVADEATSDAGGAADPASPQVCWQRLGRALFSPLAWACYVTLVAAAATVCVANPRLLPVPSHIFFSEYLLVIEVTLFLAQLPLCLLHETFHALAGRRLGLNASIGVSRRLYFVVFETALDGLVIVPRRQRYLPMLAGMLADVLTLCLFTLTAWLMLRPDGSLPLGGRLCLALAFTSVPGIATQFYFFLRTDLYYLITTVLGCVDLHTTAKALLHNWFWALCGRRDRLVDASRWHPRDAAVARWYAPLYVVGYVAMLAMLLVMLPVTWRFFHTAIRTVLDAATPPARFWDAAVLLALNAFQLGLAGYIAVRDRRRARIRPS